ncbi:MAG: TolC family protein [Planctomycetales bacterium]|jgi:cobalt-zinc-cadmium efflux system outer membrane protein
MKNAAYYTLLVAFCVAGCAQNRNATQTVTLDDVHPSENSAAVAPEKSVSAQADASSTARPHVLVERREEKSSGWQPTASLNAANSESERAVIQHVGYQEHSSAEDKPAAANTAAGLSAVDSSQPTTLVSLEQLALATNPTLGELQANVDAANGRWLQVGLKPNPVASISMQETGNDRSAGQFGALVGQEIVTANKLDLNRNSAAWRVKQAEQKLAAQRWRVLTDVRRTFYSVLVAQERLIVANDLQDIAQQSVEKAKELIKFQEPATVLTQAEIEVELAAVLVDNFQTQREAHWRRLAAVIGLPDLALQQVDGQLTTNAPKVVWDQALERLRRESPEVATAAAEVEQSRWALHRADAQSTPNFTFQAGVFYDDASSDPFATLQMSMPLPINDWNQGGIAEAQANVVAAERSVQRVELNLQQRLASVYQQYEQARKQALRYETTILQKARKNLDLNRQSYDSGQSSYLAVLTAQRSYSQARLAWLNALDQLWSATVQMEGLLLSDSLE